MTIRSWLFAGMALLVAAVCVRLGFWQLDRLRQRLEANRVISRGLEQPAAPFEEVIREDAVPVYRQVVVSGTYDHEHEILLTARSLGEQPGYHLVTPLLPPGSNMALLIDRGWIPYAEGTQPDLTRYQTKGEVTIQGVIKPSQESPAFLADVSTERSTWPQRWRAVDILGHSQGFPYPLYEVFVAQTSEDAIGPEGPIPQPEIDLSQGPHLAYALQWFGFATVAIVGGIYWLWQQSRSPS